MTSVDASSVPNYVESLFGDDLHAKRVIALAQVTEGAVKAGALGIHVIGGAVAVAREMDKKHAVKKVDRLLGNAAIDVSTLFARWVPFVVAQRDELLVALDWTEFDRDGHSTLVASLVSSHGRASPLVWRSFEKRALTGNRLDAELELLTRLREVLPTTVKRVLLLADRGISDPSRWSTLAGLGFDFITRVRGDLLVTHAGQEKPAVEWLAARGKASRLADVRVTKQRQAVAVFASVKAPKMQEAWFLVSSRGDLSAAELVQTYSRRFTIEESFRDVKDLRFGMGLAALRVSTTARRDRMLLISALAIVFLTILGAAGEAVGIDKHFKTNTSKKRQLSLFRQGCEYYVFLPSMREERARQLVDKFCELVAAHAFVTEIVSVV